jgi:hypothetical protein
VHDESEQVAVPIKREVDTSATCGHAHAHAAISLLSDDSSSPAPKRQCIVTPALAAAACTSALTQPGNQFNRYSAGDGWRQRRSADAAKRS